MKKYIDLENGRIYEVLSVTDYDLIYKHSSKHIRVNTYTIDCNGNEIPESKNILIAGRDLYKLNEV